VGLHLIEARDGGELIVFDEHKDFVGCALAVVGSRKQDFRGLVGIAATEILEAKKGFELIVERSDFGASDFVRERKSDVPAVDIRAELVAMSGEAHVPWPEAVGSPGTERKSGKRDGCQRSGTKEFCWGRMVEIAGEFFG
jgi:hypothetical protein